MLIAKLQFTARGEQTGHSGNFLFIFLGHFDVSEFLGKTLSIVKKL
jgi:hypothetical protein